MISATAIYTSFHGPDDEKRLSAFVLAAYHKSSLGSAPRNQTSGVVVMQHTSFAALPIEQDDRDI